MPPSNQPDPVVLPICTVQHDFTTVLSEILNGVVPDDNFWVSCYKFGEPSVHGKVIATLDEQDRDLILLDGREGIAMKNTDTGKNSYFVSCTSLDIEETAIAISISYPSLGETRKSPQITAFDVASDGSQFATGHHDGSVYIRPTSSKDGVPSATSKGHLSTVTSLRFFPSSRVILTSGMDFALSILSSDPPETSSYTTNKVTAARSLRGHTRAVTSTGIIARGRNVLSGSKDGTLRLWDIPSGAQIRSFAAGSNHFVSVIAISTGVRWEPSLDDADVTSDPREVETSDKIAFCALQDGSFELFDLRVKCATYRSPPGTLGVRSTLHTIAYSLEHGLLATGSGGGLVSIYDIRALGSGPTVTFRRNEAPIEDISFTNLSGASFPLASANTSNSEVGLIITTEDGLPYLAEIHPSGPRVRAELVGTDCDAVRFVRTVGHEIWSAADDGVVRCYGNLT